MLSRLLPTRRRWQLIAVLWVIVAVLGFTGLAAHRTPDSPRSALDNLYLTLQLFGFGFAIDLANLDWRLQIARFAGPAVTASAFLQASAALFREQLEQARLRFARDHVIVCGMGEKGYRLAAGFHDLGRRVVAIERDPAADHLAAARAKGIVVLVGDAADPDLLAQVRVSTAADLLAVCGDDGANAEIAAIVRTLPRAASRAPLRCSVHLVDPQLCALLRHQALRDTSPTIRVQFFNIYESGARLWLSYHAPFTGGGPSHLVVVGLDDLGQSLVVSAVQRYADLTGAASGDGGAPPLRLTLVDADASGRLQAIRLRHPGLDEHCQATTIDLDPVNPTATSVDAFEQLLEHGSPTAVYVCFPDDAVSLSMGLTIRHRLGGRRILVAVRTRSDAGLAVLLRGGGDRVSSIGLDGFGLLDRACTAGVILGGVHEQVARAIHDDYRARNPDGNLSQPWDELPEQVRESNRLAADHIAEGLAAVGCDLEPLHRWGVGDVTLAPDEVDVLAQREHERWKSEREAAGWRYGPARDDATKENPLLVAWDQLPEPSRQSNRDAVAELPAMLARAGFELVRLDPDPESQPQRAP